MKLRMTMKWVAVLQGKGFNMLFDAECFVI